MRILLFGATGMVGQGVLRECLLDQDVDRVVSIGRSSLGKQHPKLSEIIHKDSSNLTAIEPELAGFDACFFCLGISSAGRAERDYRRITYDLTLAVAQTLVRLNHQMVFIYVSGTGTDSSERGGTMWARVKGQTENALLRLPFKAAYMFRPGFIQPMHGIASKTRLYRSIYAVVGPIFPVLKWLFPKYVTTTELMGRAMVNAVKRGASKSVLESEDINLIADET